MVLPLRSPPDADTVRGCVRLGGNQCRMWGPGTVSPTGVIGPSPAFPAERRPPWAGSLHAMRLTPGGIALQSP
jgi:hypothetical protein